VHLGTASGVRAAAWARARAQSTQKTPNMVANFTGFLLVGRPPAQLVHLQFARNNGTLDDPIPMARELPFAPTAQLVAHSDGVKTTELLPRLGGMYRGHAPWGLISATIHCSTWQHCALDAVLHVTAGPQHAIGTMQCTQNHCRPAGLTIRSIPSSHRRQLQLDSAAPPYGRMTGCPSVMHTVKLGLVLDFGFVTARGGRAGALLAVAEAVARANLIFEDQVGLSLLVEHVVLSESSDGDYTLTGPNE
jgi:hypothetical protein